ncbi:lipopolysaccharide biosynthesis protein [Aeromicrobium sp. CFBP 8757]|uniref:lipopolysaccharide biosynthesis protein n=1 Tax=Aeromicrobium sp. CFBP 8757 TaxID=2775288 RepID=UPI00352FF3B3
MSDASALRGRAVRGAAWSLADKWGVRLASLLTFAILARLLEPEQFGLVAAAQIVVMVLQTISNQGIVQALIVSKPVTDRTLATATVIAVITSILTVAAIASVAKPLGELFGQDDFVPVVSALAGTLIVQAAGAVPTAELQRQMEFKRLAQRSVISALLSGIAGVAAALAGWGVWALVTQAFTQVVVATVLAWVAARLRPRLGWNGADARRLMRFAGPVMIADVVAVAIAQGDNLVVGAVLGSVALGYYTVAFRLLNVVVDVFTGAVSAVALPVFAQLSENLVRSRNAYLRVTQLSFAAATPVFIGLAVVAPLAIEVTFGPQWDRSVPVFQVLCGAGVAMAALYFDRPVLLAAGMAKLELTISVVLAAATVGAALIGAQYGLVATAACVTARMYLTWPLRFLAVRRAISISLREYIVNLRGVAAAATAQGVVSVALLQVNDGAWCVLAAGVGTMAYVVTLWMTDRSLIRSGLSVLGDLRPASRRPTG